MIDLQWQHRMFTKYHKGKEKKKENILTFILRIHFHSLIQFKKVTRFLNEKRAKGNPQEKYFLRKSGTCTYMRAFNQGQNILPKKNSNKV